MKEWNAVQRFIYLSFFPTHSFIIFFLYRLVTSYRTFFMQAKSENEANEWVAILRWKLVRTACCLLGSVVIIPHFISTNIQKTIKAGNSGSRVQTDLA